LRLVTKDTENERLIFMTAYIALKMRDRRDTELLSPGSEDWRGDGRDTSTRHSERQSTTNEDDEISTFSLLAAAVILAAMQCAFLCAH